MHPGQVASPSQGTLTCITYVLSIYINCGLPTPSAWYHRNYFGSFGANIIGENCGMLAFMLASSYRDTVGRNTCNGLRVAVTPVKLQTAENHVTWRVTSMAALSWGSSSTGLAQIAWLSLPWLATCLFAGPGRRWRPEKEVVTTSRDAAATRVETTAAAAFAVKGRRS